MPMALGHEASGIVRDVGAGRAILLNFPIWSYPNTALHDDNDAAAALFEAIFDAAGATRPLEVLDASGRRHRNIEVVRWRTGPGIEVVAMNLKRLAGDNADPDRFRGRLARWEKVVTDSGARGWRTFMDANKLPGYLEEVRS